MPVIGASKAEQSRAEASGHEREKKKSRNYRVVQQERRQQDGRRLTDLNLQEPQFLEV